MPKQRIYVVKTLVLSLIKSKRAAESRTETVSFRNFLGQKCPSFLAEKGNFFTQYFPRFLGGKISKDTGLRP